MDQSIQILRTRVRARAARRQLNGAVIGAAATITLSALFWSAVWAAFH